MTNEMNSPHPQDPTGSGQEPTGSGPEPDPETPNDSGDEFGEELWTPEEWLEFAPSDHADGVPLPVEFFRDVEQTPFVVCQSCDAELTSTHYLIAKAYLGDRCTLEFAVCLGCLLELSERYSEESLAAFENTEDDPDEWLQEEQSLDECCRCQRHVDDCLNYERIALCTQDRLLRRAMICGSCESETEAKLSAQTRGEIDDFMNRILPGVPELEVDLPRSIFL